MTRDLLASLIIFAGLGLAPLVITSLYWQSVIIVAMFYALSAVGWNLLAGYTGQFSFATAGFSMIGGYTSALLVLRGLPPVIGIAAGGLLSFLLGAMIGRLCFRLTGVYLALTTLSFAEVVRLVISSEYDITRGDLGLSVPPLYPPDQPLFYHFTFLATLLIVQLILYGIMRSPAGLYLQAIREDELAARTRGIAVIRWKTLAFSISSGLIGLAGAMYVHFIGLATPEMGTILQTGLVIAMCVIGGMGSLPGPLIGAFVVEILSEYFTTFGLYHRVLFALLIIIVVRFFREGLYGMMVRVAVRHG